MNSLLNRRSAALLGGVFFFSGLSSLIYQVVWQRILTMHYGVLVGFLFVQRKCKYGKKGKMTAQTQEKNKMTLGEYLAFERNSLDIKHEFFNCEVFAMVGAKKNHTYINANLTRELGNKFKTNKSTCKAVSNDMRVKIAENYAYPDIVIHCGDAEFEDNEFDTLTNPVVIMEILSDSTEAFDRGKKFAYYRAIPALQEYILVSQDEYHVEQFTRIDDGWKYRSHVNTDQVLKMESVNCELPLSEIYWDIQFESESD